ncbi:MAG: glycoside hydrolase, partial [Treponema sp.]|nr:glycoside hydrolase [Treponema sp.]
MMYRKSPKFFALSFIFLSLALSASPVLYAQTSLFWEQPEAFSSGQGYFPVTAYNNDFGIVVWQEPTQKPVSSPAGTADGSINIVLAVKRAGESWEKRGIIGGPYFYSGSIPSIISAVIDSKGQILIAAAASASQAEILVSADQGVTFERYRLDTGTESSLAPKIAICSDGSYLLFITRGSETSLSIYYARSPDGRTWSSFQPFVTDPGMQLTFLPSQVSFNGQEYVVFQSFTGSTETTPSFQLFIKISADGGLSWSPAQRLTQFRDSFSNTTASADYFDNQRPQLSVQGDSLFLVWERRYRNTSPQIYAMRLNGDGTVAGIAERVNSANAYCNNPIAFDYNGDTRIIWFDNRRGSNNIYLAQRTGITWDNTELSASSSWEASFGRPIVDRDGLFIFWQNSTRQGSTQVFYVSPDTTVNPVQIKTGNFISGKRTRGDHAQISWNIPVDSSGIQGFSYSWSQDVDVEPEKVIQIYVTTGKAPSVDQIATEDGEWYFTVIAQDYAGNWSPPSRVTYIRDTIPPPAAPIVQPALDANGYLVSNTFAINWDAPPAPDIAGYSWNLEYLNTAQSFNGMNNEQFTASVEKTYTTESTAISRIQGTGTSVSYSNVDDGVWRFTVRAIDEAGNVGPLSTLFFRTNKYVPHTIVTLVDAEQDEQGVLTVRILGRGFSQGGDITRIILDRDGAPPYDREFLLSRNDFTIVSDREIRGLRADGIDKGLYRVGLEHPVRGLYFTDPVVSINEIGTVKFGDYSDAWKPSWARAAERRFSFDTGYLILFSVFILCGVALFISVRGIGATIAEGAAIRLDAAALISGDLMPSEKKKQITRIKKRGIGLRLKLASFTIVLVLAVVIMVSVPLYVTMTQNQRQTLFRGLWDRSSVLLEGLATSARAYLPLRSALELGMLPGQMNSVPEARYITITGYNPDSSIFDDQVWATNDPDILKKIDTADFQPGVSRLNDVLSSKLQGIAAELNDRAKQEVGSLSESINSLTQEGQALALATDAASRQRLEDIQVQLRTLQTRVNQLLADIANPIGSEPDFSLDNFVVSPDHMYIFYKPVMYRQGSEDVYFRGLVRLEISIDSILNEIASGQVAIIRIILLVALVALITGAIGALILSTLIIRPIRQLVSHVEIIRD